MIDGDIRALQVKMLSEPQLGVLHDHEAGDGYPMDMHSITARFRLEGIKSYYRVTASRNGRVMPLRELMKVARGACFNSFMLPILTCQL